MTWFIWDILFSVNLYWTVEIPVRSNILAVSTCASLYIQITCSVPVFVSVLVSQNLWYEEKGLQTGCVITVLFCDGISLWQQKGTVSYNGKKDCAVTVYLEAFTKLNYILQTFITDTRARMRGQRTDMKSRRGKPRKNCSWAPIILRKVISMTRFSV